MSQAFIIMQIGNPELDRVCEAAIVPALKACGLDPKRVDKHNKGGLLKSEIIAFIEGSDIIVADLTDERPNCYLEVGYTMGVNKFRNLVLLGTIMFRNFVKIFRKIQEIIFRLLTLSYGDLLL